MMNHTYQTTYKPIPEHHLYLKHEIEANCRKLADETYQAYVSVTFFNRAGDSYKKHCMWRKDGYKTRQEAYKAANLGAAMYIEMDVHGYPDSSISYEKNKRFYKD